MRIICKHDTDGCSVCEHELVAALEALEEAQAEIERLKQLAAYYPAWLPGESE